MSSILALFKKIGSFHNTVYSTVKDLKESGWLEVHDIQPGDVLIWDAQERETGEYSHVGFYVGDGNAISTSDETGTPTVHHPHLNKKWTAIARVYRLPEWQFGTRAPAPPIDNPDPL